MIGPVDLLEAELARALGARRRAGLHRVPQRPAGVDLTSNDYLGYARDPGLARTIGDAVREHGAGSGAARLLRGHGALFEEAEARLAAFSHRESALLFPSGFQLNVGLIPALVGPADLVVSDALNHASLIDGIRLSGATKAVVPHGDLDAFDRALADGATARRRLVVVESLYSMDGDLAPLAELVAIGERRGALVIVDEAHATGLYGPGGAGRVAELGLQDRVLCSVHTGGKALGVGGAWVASSSTLIDHLVNHCRSFIYSTAAVPAIPAGLLAAIRRRAADQPTVDALLARASGFRARLRDAGADTGASESPIVPVILGDPGRALTVAAALQQAGFDVRPVRPPTVPEGTARLRLTVRAPVSAATLTGVIEALTGHLA